MVNEAVEIRFGDKVVVTADRAHQIGGCGPAQAGEEEGNQEKHVGGG